MNAKKESNKETQTQIGVRISATLIARADKMAGAMSVEGLPVTRSEVMRLAMFKGLELLENEHGKKKR